MIFGITQVQEVGSFTKNVANSLWMVELRFAVITIDEPNFSVTNLIFKSHCFFIDYDEAIIGSV